MVRCLNCGEEFEEIKRKVKIVIGYKCLVCGKIYNLYDAAEQCEIRHAKRSKIAGTTGGNQNDRG